MSVGALVATVALPVGITDLVVKTNALAEQHGPGLVAIQYDEAALGIFTPGDVLKCPTCDAALDEHHQNHSAL